VRPRPDDPRRLPGWRLRRLAQGLCSAKTLEHVVDPIVADLQHEWSGERSRVGRAWVRVQGYAAFSRALVLHTVRAASRHLGRNAFGATADERAFHRRAGVGTVGALAFSTSIVALWGIATSTRSLVYVLTHLRWPGPPTAAEVLPTALAIAAHPRGLLLLVPCFLVGTIPPSLMLGILVGLRPAGTTRPRSFRPYLRGVAGVSVAATLFTFVLTGWIVPKLGERYREFFMTSVFPTSVTRAARPEDLRALSLPELSSQARVDDAVGQGDAAQRHRVEWHRRLAWAAASLVFGLVGLGLGAQRRGWTIRRAMAMTVAVTLFYYLGLLHVTARALALAPSSPLVVVWSADIALALFGAALILFARRRVTSSLVTA
jgi:hypothetical protein